MKAGISILTLVALAGGAVRLAPAQSSASSAAPTSAYFVLPHVRRIANPRPSGVVVTAVRASVDIREQVAVTTLEFDLQNPTGSRLESELVIPVPGDVVIKGFAFQGQAQEPTARLLPKDEARRLYDSIVARARDPAILEFVGLQVVRSSVFPVEPRGTQRVRLTYEQILPRDGSRVDFFLPRSESVDYRVPWKINVRIRSKQSIATVYSPSHAIETRRSSPNDVTVTPVKGLATEPGPFRLSYLVDSGDVTASLLAYPDPSVGGGYFLLLAGLPPMPRDRDRPAIQREVTLVIDRSGSMRGEKIEQVREAALQVLEGLDDGESFNILIYNEAVDAFSDQGVVKSAETMARAREYLRTVRSRGGTNIHDALNEALRAPPRAGTLPIVLFLTDGLPTMGQTSEVAIRTLAKEHNPHRKRVFTFGVGVDVNTPLLETVAFATRGTTTVVLPNEDVEVKVAGVFRRLSGPILAEPSLALRDATGATALHRVRDLLPEKLPDLYEGDQLVLLGQYVDGAPITFVLGGNFLGQERTFQFTFDFEKSTTRNAFVPRLWASRKIGMLEDAIRQLGADLPPGVFANVTAVHPHMAELVNEIVRLSTEFGILTEYTAFFAEDGTNLAALEDVRRVARDNFTRRALICRSGRGSWNQDLNRQRSKQQKVLNLSNEYLNEDLEKVEITSVQQIADRAFYRKRGRWIDSRIVDKSESSQPSSVIEFGSPAFRELSERLASENRQGCISLRGDIVLLVDGKTVLVRGPSSTTRTGN